VDRLNDGWLFVFGFFCLFLFVLACVPPAHFLCFVCTGCSRS
jgi:hypothetical protein